MIDPTPFEKAVKMAREAERILNRLNAFRLHNINVTLSGGLKKTNEQMKDLLRRSMALNREAERLSYIEAGTTRSRGKWVKFYDDAILKATKLRDISKHKLDMLDKNLAAKVAAGTATKKDFRDHARLSKMHQKKFDLQDMRIDVIDNLKKMERSNRFRLDRLNYMKFVEDQSKSGPLGFLHVFGSWIKNMGPLFGMLALATTAVILVIGKFRAGLKATIDAGLAASQRKEEIFRANRIVGQGAAKGAALDPVEVIKAQMSLAERLGKLDIDDKVILKSAELTRQIGLSSDEAGDLLNYFIRIRGLSADAAALSTEVLQATAVSNKMSPALIMRDVASNAANFAKSGKSSADEMARAAIYVRQIGSNLGNMANIADRIVTDFEGTLMSQATVGAFVPGFDMSSLLVASQFGTDANIATELKRAVDSLGVDMDNLPRSIKLGIANSIGLSVEELTRIYRSQPNVISADGKAIQDAQSHAANELQKAMANPLDSLVRYTFGIFNIITRWFGNSAEKAALKSDDELKPSPSIFKSLRAAITGNSSYAEDYAELMKRDAAAGGPSGPTWSQLFGFNKTVAKQQAPAAEPAKEQTFSPMANNTGLEKKMDTLINLFKSGGIKVELDGKKVSSGLLDANRYG